MNCDESSLTGEPEEIRKDNKPMSDSCLVVRD